MTTRIPAKLKLRGPLEQDIQAVILAFLGKEQVELKQTKSGPRWKGTGLHLSSDGQVMVWRQNSGKPIGAGFNFRGAPAGTADIIGVAYGFPLALEVKRESTYQNPDQREWQRKWEAAGGVYAVVRSPGQAQAVIEDLRRRRQAA
jgi:hypothetical protein